MHNWYNSSGKPLSSTSWLKAHHLAKLPERLLFAHSLLKFRPKRIVDLGCGPGLWLDLLNDIAPVDCELIGVDSDSEVLNEARIRSARWDRPSQFINLDIESDARELPNAEMFLAFNFFPYLLRPDAALDTIKQKLTQPGVLVVRQYDGSLLRFGPLDQQRRGRMDASLQVSVAGSKEFRHYDLDETFQMLAASSFKERRLSFELFQRSSPYPVEFTEYMVNTIEWTLAHTADDIAVKLDRWLAENAASGFSNPSYFIEVDLVGWLS